MSFRTAGFVTFIGAAIALVYLYAIAGAQPQLPSAAASAEPFLCPPNVTSCKVITISPEEEQSLLGPNMVFDHAEWANRAGLSGVIAAWRKKLTEAPPGTPAPKPTPAGALTPKVPPSGPPQKRFQKD